MFFLKIQGACVQCVCVCVCETTGEQRVTTYKLGLGTANNLKISYSFMQYMHHDIIIGLCLQLHQACQSERVNCGFSFNLSCISWQFWWHY